VLRPALLAIAALLAACGPREEPTRGIEVHAAWKRKFRGEITSLSLDAAGRKVIVATTPDAKGRGDNRIHVLDEKGGIAWQAMLDHKVLGTSVSADGRFIAAFLLDSTLRAWNADGDSLWKVSCVGPPEVAAAGNLVACHSTGEEATPEGSALQVFDRRGKLRWSWDDPSGLWDLRVSDSGNVIAGITQAGKVVCLDGRGRPMWTKDLGTEVGTVAISPGDGAVVVVGSGIEGERVDAYDRAGNALWTAPVPGGVDSLAASRGGSFVALANNTILGQRVFVFDARGKLFWKYQLDRPSREPVKVRISQGGDRVVAGLEEDGQPTLLGWDRHGELTTRIPLGTDLVDFDLSRDARRLAAVTRGGRLFFFNLGQPRKEVAPIPQAGAPPHSKPLPRPGRPPTAP
jgi:DNA-binding beta-propeller fold protein YncE